MISYHFCIDTLFFWSTTQVEHCAHVFVEQLRRSQTSTHRHNTEQRNSEKLVAVIILTNAIISKFVGKVIRNWQLFKS